MNEKCFCHIGMADGTRYKVKDADARSSIENLSSEIDTIKTDTNTSINELKDSIQDTTQDTMVVLGDSWSMPNYPYIDNQSDMWMNIVGKQLNLKVKNYAVSGGAYTHNNPTYKIATQYNTLTTDETLNPNKVKYVFVFAGINDLNHHDVGILATECDSLFSNLKTYFNKSQIIIIGCNTQDTMVNGENNASWDNYRIAMIIQGRAINNGLTFIDSVPFLYGIDNSIDSTNHHPTAYGQRVLASKILSCMNGNSSGSLMSSSRDFMITSQYNGNALPSGIESIQMKTNVCNDKLYLTWIIVTNGACTSAIDIVTPTICHELPIMYVPITVFNNGLDTKGSIRLGTDVGKANLMIHTDTNLVLFGSTVINI